MKYNKIFCIVVVFIFLIGLFNVQTLDNSGNNIFVDETIPDKNIQTSEFKNDTLNEFMVENTTLVNTFENETIPDKNIESNRKSEIKNNEWIDGESVRVDVNSFNKSSRSITYDGNYYAYDLKITGLNQPYKAVSDNFGDIYIVSYNNKSVDKYSNGILIDSIIFPIYVRSIAVDNSNFIYVMDNNCNITKFSSNFKKIDNFFYNCTTCSFGGGSSSEGGMEIDKDNNIYVVDTVNDSINIFDSSFNLINQFDIDTPYNYDYARDIAIDKDNNIYVVSDSIESVKKFDSYGNLLLTFDDTFLDTCYGIAVFDEYVFVSNFDNTVDKIILIYDRYGNLLGDFGLGSIGDPKNDNNVFANIRFLSIDANGNLYIADSGNNRVTKYSYISITGTLAVGNTIELDNFYDILKIHSYYVFLSNITFHVNFYDLVNPDLIGLYVSVLFDGLSIFDDNYINVNFSDDSNYGSGELTGNIIIGHFLHGNSKCVLSTFDSGNNEYIFDTITYNISSFSVVNVMYFKFNKVFTGYTGINFVLRSQYIYLENGIFQHRLLVENFAYGNSITIYAPMSWNYSSISPTATIFLSDDNYIVSNTYPVTYDIYFLSGVGFGRDYIRQKEILAISDETDEYLQDGGFENGIGTDFFVDPSYLFDSTYSNYTIVSNGIASIKLVDNDIYSDIIVYKTASSSSSVFDLPNDEYYISFDYYIESFTGSYFQVGYYNSAWQYNNLETTISDRWIHYNCRVNVIGDGYGRDIFLKFSSAQGVIFLDNIRFCKVNTLVISKIDSNADTYNQISSKFNYWTSYGLFPAKNENCTFYLFDRTAQIQIDSFSDYTDSNGKITWNWYGNLEQKEYMIKNICWSSFWSSSSYNYEFTKDLSNWGAVNVGGSYSENYNTDSKIGSNSCEFKMTDSDADWGMTWYYGSNIDYSDADFIMYYYKANTTTSYTLYLYMSSASNMLSRGGITVSSTNTWLFYYYHLDDLTITGNPDQTQTNNIRFRYSTASVKLSVQIDGLRYISSQKYYFTPMLVSEKDYAESELNDIWDFSEGDKENFRVCTTCSGYLVPSIVKDGGITLIRDNWSGGSSTWSVLGIETYSNIINTPYYSNLVLRAYSNIEMKIGFLREGEYGTVYGYPTTQRVRANSWNIVDVDLSDYSNWLVDTAVVNLFIAFQTYDNSNLTVNDYIIIDYIKIVHREFFEGFSWEFNEKKIGMTAGSYSYENDMKCDSSGTNCNIENGIVTVYLTAPWGGMGIGLGKSKYFDFYEEDMKSIWIKFSSNTVGTWYEYGDGGQVIASFVPNSNQYVWENRIIIFTDYSGNSDPITNGFTRFESNIAGRELKIDYIRFVKEESPNLFEDTQNFYLVDEQSYYYKVWSDYNFLGLFQSFESIPKNLTVGNHRIMYQAVDSVSEYDCLLSSVIYSYEYEIAYDDFMFISFFNQKGEYLDFRNYKIWIDGSRIASNYYYFDDISQTVNLTVTDIFNYTIYSNSVETFEKFKDINLEQYSFKIQNHQFNPVKISMIRSGGATFSTWIFTNEVVEFFLYPATYTTTVYYTDVSSSFIVSENTTSVNYNYVISEDSAIQISGYTIKDVFDNTLSLSTDLINVNTSLSSQLYDIDINVDNVNSSLSNQIVNIDISLTNTNTTLVNQLNTINSLITNLNTDLTTQTNYLYYNISNLQTNLTNQFTNLNISIYNNLANLTTQLNDIDIAITNLDTQILTQTLYIIANISNLDSSITNQFNNLNISITNNLANLTTQLNDIDIAITNLDTQILTQTLYIIANISNLDSSITNQFNNLNISINNHVAVIESQINSVNVSIANLETVLLEQVIIILSNITNTNSSIHSQLNTINSLISVLDSNLLSQTNYLYYNISNLDSSISVQFNDLNISITNNLANLTYQFNDISTSITNVNTNILTQANYIVSNITNANSTLHSQILQLLNNIYNYNTTIYDQTVTILSDIANTNTTLYTEAINIFTKVDNTNTTLFLQNVNTLTYLYLEKILNFDIFEAKDFIVIYLSTNFQNSTLIVYDADNNELLETGSEGFTYIDKNTTVGIYHLNITVQFYNGYELYYNYTYQVLGSNIVVVHNQDPPITIIPTNVYNSEVVNLDSLQSNSAVNTLLIITVTIICSGILSFFAMKYYNKYFSETKKSADTTNKLLTKFVIKEQKETKKKTDKGIKRIIL